MSILANFRSKSFVEQISLLAEIESDNALSLIPDLLELLKNPLDDDAVDGAVGDTLRALLAQSEEETVKGLKNSDPKIRDLCIQIAGRAKFASSVSVLISIADEIDNDDALLAILSALDGIDSPDSKEIFLKHIAHSDPLVSSICIEGVGKNKSTEAMDALFSFVETSKQDDKLDSCDIRTEKAVRALGNIANDKALEFLTINIHHKNPTARQIIIETLSGLGNKALPFLEAQIRGEDVDCKILSTNVLGEIKTKEAEDILAAAFHNGNADSPNVRFAIYDALGEVCSLKGLICLIDGLLENDETLLTAVLSSLDKNINPAVTSQIGNLIKKGSGHSRGLMRALIKSRATTLFQNLFELEPTIGDQLVELISRSKVEETISTFAEALCAMNDPRAKVQGDKLKSIEVKSSGKKLLAVDDSRSMLLFYQDLCSDLGFNVATAMNGREALDLLESGEEFDIIISDMNMPVMNGMDFIKNVRANIFIGETPILMATTESEKSQYELAKKVGATGFINKPIKPPELKAAIEKALEPNTSD